MNILNRTACLGGWVTDAKLGSKHNYNNQQKVRVDMFLDIMNEKINKPEISYLENILVREDMSGIYEQSEKLLWLTVENPDYLIMDSYSELTDKKFIHKDGWMVCGLYSDLNFKEYKSDFEFHGLLNINEIHNNYKLFFEYIKNRWNVPIIFMHFPTDFDPREKYKTQGKAILEALDDLKNHYDIQNIIADPEAIEQKDSDHYHFTDKTVNNMASKIKI
jgi:hypothetical protein